MQTDFERAKILVSGAGGFLGRHVVEQLLARGARAQNLITPRSGELDLREPDACARAVEGMDVVIHLAAKVGGIGLNREKPAELYYDNLMMGTHLIHQSYKAGVGKFVCVGTICAYPKFTPVPFREDDLWNGYPEETNAPYGVAKKALLVQLQAYRAQYGFNGIYLLPVNLYGPWDNFDPKSSHVIPALIHKIALAQQAGQRTLPVWGDGSPTREFLYVDDAAAGIVEAARTYDGAEPVNLGTGEEISIRDLVEMLCELMDFKGEILWETDKPNGQPRRCLDTSRARAEFGFAARTGLAEGLRRTLEWYARHGERLSLV
ncbi:GDP-L-fucose synthase family protein [Gloeobacter morelensis]|uniref:GDP-L-fucose synthase n=1 Tax=Gloeobacter morelensis MG652769 TaxID=2781736 RepID=A0ABY3PQQ0_9CYAN|nr:GDP-L-fucose synthase [Gloeobacter morelensis]UFP95967.1 GDP-L-fucose synthase [Gloeobacter morelensis MG652769]